MPVIINEFEVVPQPPTAERETESREAAAPPPKPDRREIEKTIEHERERMLRVWAH